MVILMGEFGRTPKINVSQGRDHWSRNWSVCLAGGGIAGGRAIGRTDEAGMEIAERPVSVADFYATIYKCFGVNPDKKYMGPGARPTKILDGGEVVKELLA